ncbi:MAG: hypothetical protein V1644_02485 [Candidatus Micrarchaeota archaeon]
MKELNFSKHIAKQLEKKNTRISKGERIFQFNPIVVIPGTHERRTKGLVNVVEMLDSAGLVANCHNKTVIIEKNNEKVAVIGMAGIPDEYAIEVIKAAQFKPVENCFNIFISHQTLKEVIPLSDKFMTMDDLPTGFDLYINGHIHWRREIKSNGKTLLIPGSTVITQMLKNETEKKGFWLYDTLTRNYEFIYINSRPFFYKEILIENASAETVKNAVEKVVSEIITENKTTSSASQTPLIKLKITGSLAKGINSPSIDLNSIAASFTNAEVYIDKEFDVLQSLKEKIELLRKIKTEEKSVSELGIAVLKEKLKQNKFTMENEEELFSLLSEGEIEKAITLVKNSKSNPST